MEQLNAKQFIESNYCTLRLFILISFGFLIIPAYSQSIKSLSDIKWKKSLTDIKSKMANNGYYKRNTMPEAFIFYDDGTLVFCNSIPNDTVSYRGGSFPPGGYYDQETKRWESGSSGVYKIEGDTIYANLYFENSIYFSIRFQLYFQLFMYKLKFRIVDRETIIWCEEHEMDGESARKIHNDTLHFIPCCSTLPPPDTRIRLKKKWLWEDKKDWKAYKKRFKKQKSEPQIHNVPAF